jgi:hypothetical protein
MTLPAGNGTGAISLGQVNTELGLSATATISLGDANVKKLVRIASGVVDLNTFHGKTKFAITGGPTAISYVGASAGGAVTTGSTTMTVAGNGGYTYVWTMTGTGTLNGGTTATASVTSSPANGTTNSGTLYCTVTDATNGFGAVASGSVGWSVQNTSSGRVAITLNISNVKNYNIFNNRGGTYVAGTSDVTVNVSGVIGSTSTAAYALDTGTGWAAGDTVKIVNTGYIAGKGGTGGAGGQAYGVGGTGTAGGPGLRIQKATTITNGTGYIYSGGGGGGGGAAARTFNSHVWYQGGGGGGGAGNSPGPGGDVAGQTGGLTIGGAGGTNNPPNSYSGGGGGGTGGNKGALGQIGPWAGTGGGHGVAIQGASLVTWAATIPVGSGRVYGGTAG